MKKFYRCPQGHEYDTPDHGFHQVERVVPIGSAIACAECLRDFLARNGLLMEEIVEEGDDR